MRKCGIDDWSVLTQSRTTPCCHEPATMEVHDLSGRVIGKCCPKHAKETELMVLGVNAFIGAKYISKN